MPRFIYTNWLDAAATFDLILSNAVRLKISQDEMPQFVICLSDMQFNQAGPYPNFEIIKAKFAEAGYKLPKLIFWQLNGSYANSPVTKDDENVAIVSGFSPSILSAVLSGNSYGPYEIMLETIMNDRYSFM